MMICDLCGDVMETLYKSEVLPQKDLCEECYGNMSRIVSEYDVDYHMLGDVVDILNSVGFAVIADRILVCDDEECFDD